MTFWATCVSSGERTPTLMGRGSRVVRGFTITDGRGCAAVAAWDFWRHRHGLRLRTTLQRDLLDYAANAHDCHLPDPNATSRKKQL